MCARGAAAQDPQQVGACEPTRRGALAVIALGAAVLVALRRSPALGRWAGLGATLHETLTAQRLFATADDFARLEACLPGPIPQPGALRPEETLTVDAIAMGSLQRRGGDRTRSARWTATAST